MYIYVSVSMQTHTHSSTVEYYSAIKKEIMPFATIWMDLEIPY